MLILFLLFQISCKTVRVTNTSEFSVIVSISATGEETSYARSSSPVFLISKLEPSTGYTVKVWASNKHGTSDPNYLTTTTLNVPDIAERKLKGGGGEAEWGDVWVMVFIGMTVLVLVFIVTVMTAKHCREERVMAETEDHTLYHQIQNTSTERQQVRYMHWQSRKSKRR